jgi:hypothetical protein
MADVDAIRRNAATNPGALTDKQRDLLRKVTADVLGGVNATGMSGGDIMTEVIKRMEAQVGNISEDEITKEAQSLGITSDAEARALILMQRGAAGGPAAAAAKKGVMPGQAQKATDKAGALARAGGDAAAGSADGSMRISGTLNVTIGSDGKGTGDLKANSEGGGRNYQVPGSK